VFRARLQDFGARYYASLGSGHATPLVDGLDRIAPEQCAIDHPRSTVSDTHRLDIEQVFPTLQHFQRRYK
jgi:hypothetical protein